MQYQTQSCGFTSRWPTTGKAEVRMKINSSFPGTISKGMHLSSFHGALALFYCPSHS